MSESASNAGRVPRIMCIGLEPKSKAMVQAFFATHSAAELSYVDTTDDFGAQFEQWNNDSFDTIFCGSALIGMAGIELAQVLVNQAPHTVKYYITETTNNYEPRSLIKNGFTASFVIPMDSSLIQNALLENLANIQTKMRSMRTVRLPDIGVGDELPFETYLYLPLNKKYIKYTSANQAIEKVKIDKLEERQMSQLWVDHRDMNKFYQYSAKKMRDLGEEGISSTERKEKLKDSVRGLFSDIFDQSVKADFDQGRDTVKHCESIISNYITKGASSDWYNKLMAAMGESGDTYNHASNVSTFAALFAIGIGHEHPEDLAMAGLFHDLGLSQLPHEMQEKRESDLLPAERELYYTHMEKSVTMIKNKRIILPDAVERAILLHHEHWSGRGFPKQLANGRISREAQLICFSDQFDELTRYQAGQKKMTPLEALDTIRANGSIDPDLISLLKRLLDKDANLAKSG